MSEQHPIRGGKEHPSLDVVQRLFGARQLKPQQAGHQAQRDGLHPVQRAQHLRACFLEISLAQHLRNGTLG